MPRLTEQQKNEVRSLYSSGGFTYSMLAKRFHISKSTVSKLIDAETKRKYVYRRGCVTKPIRNKEPVRRHYNRKELVKNLIEVMSEYSLADNWNESYLMQQLLSCGLTKEDFEMAGYKGFYEEYFKEAV